MEERYAGAVGLNNRDGEAYLKRCYGAQFPYEEFKKQASGQTLTMLPAA